MLLRSPDLLSIKVSQEPSCVHGVCMGPMSCLTLPSRPLSHSMFSVIYPLCFLSMFSSSIAVR